MTDEPGSPTGRHRRPRQPKFGDSGAPVTTIVLLGVAAVVVFAAFVVLRSVTDGDDETVGGGATSTVASAPATVPATPVATLVLSTNTTTTTTTTTAPPPASRSDATIVVANASGINRSATAMTAELEADGYTVIPVANSTGPRLDTSIIYYVEGDAGASGVARLLKAQIPTAQTLPMPNPPPLDRPLNGATVALMLGVDAAGKPLPEPPPD